MNYFTSLLQSIDIYGNSFNLLINKKTKLKTNLGGLFSIVTFILFILFFIQEFKEVLFKTNPTIFSYILNDYKVENSFTHPYPETPFFLKIYNNEIVKYVTLKYHLTSYLKNNTFIFHHDILEQCTQYQIEKLNNFTYFKLGDEKEILFCPKNLNDIFNQEMLNFKISITITECEDDKCIYDENFYQKLKENINLYSVALYFINSQKVLLNYEKPFEIFFSKNIISLGSNQNNLIYELMKEEIYTKGGLILNENKVDKNFFIKIKSLIQREEYLGLFEIKFINEIGIFQRTYKTFSSALAHCLSILKLLKLIIQYLTKKNSYYTKNTILADKIFDYENSICSLKKIENINSVNKSSNIEIDIKDLNSSNKSIFIIEDIDNVVKRKNKKFHISCCNRIKLFFCFSKKLNQNKNLRFYLATKTFINKYTSVEQLLKQSIELEFLKYFMLNKNQHLQFNKIKRLIIDNDLYSTHNDIYNYMINIKSDVILNSLNLKEEIKIKYEEKLNVFFMDLEKD